MPKLSIITVNLNNVNGLSKTIESVAGQSFSDFEYIVIDGGSDDGSLSILKKFSHKITYWVSEPDKGIYQAMNKGLKHSNGEIITFLNSGDEYYSRFSLELVLNFLKFKWPLADLFFFDFIYQSGKNKTVVSSLDVINKFVIYNKGFGHPSTFYKKKLFELFGGFDENYKISADRDFYMKVIVKHKIAFAYFPFTVSVFIEGGLSTNSNYKGILQVEDRRVINTYYNSFERRIIRMSLLKKIISKKYIGDLIVWLLNWKLRQI